jgi:hypothetical protein
MGYPPCASDTSGLDPSVSRTVWYATGSLARQSMTVSVPGCTDTEPFGTCTRRAVADAGRTALAGDHPAT